MAEIIVTVDNTDATKAAIHNALLKGLEMVGLKAEGYAKLKCPTDTGRLKNSITHRTDDEAAYIGTNVEYAPYVEMGTVKMAARPYLKPAATEHTSEYADMIKSCLENA